ncbi:VRR-NUC domain-containing protein [Paludicola sp. MB14-C6]|uniref:VRR-NUC domain-containing protein n=1 Tax=Paludihabitans sp. MB14-C6 TaxID=3070656 RepID=UPI0027DCE517|nr:VRR-NUC domain-containing protein [Paludicola sp. MB14-C6]WMJ23475.1 VRR-NUC domain-containing protein [Paludicola sp. MB14-C6]
MVNLDGISPQRRKELYGTKPISQIGQPLEGAEQQALFQWSVWMSHQYPELELLYHTPNEGKRSKSQGAKLVREGLKKGVPDIHLPVPSGRFVSLYIEMKRKGQAPTKDQLDWIEKLQLHGNAARVCYSCDEAIDVIMKYLKGEL